MSVLEKMSLQMVNESFSSTATFLQLILSFIGLDCCRFGQGQCLKK